MFRNQLKEIEKWLSEPERKPLILRGARQVGKSTLVRLMAEQQGRPLMEVNLERHPQLSGVFATLDTQKILAQIRALPNQKPQTPETILFLDEIQAAPEAIPALRYFHEDLPTLPVVSAGSLLEFVLADHRFSMPVGRIRYLHMGPMTFTEFLQALGENELHNAVNTYEFGAEIGPVVHGRLLEKLRQYYFIGGMPAAIDAYIKKGTLEAAREAHTDIIDTYRDDFPKYAGSRDLTRLLKVFNFAARSVGRKVKYKQISEDDHSTALRKDIELLSMARVIAKIIHSHSSGLPLQADLEEKIYKLLFLDIGLMNSIAGLHWNILEAMNDARLINEGAIAEQFIGQHLQALLARGVNRELTYWTRENKSSNAEVDFVIALNGEIVPIEVKAGAKGSLRSLHQFMGEKPATLAVRFDANLPSAQTVETVIRKDDRSVAVKYRLVSLPLYLVERLFDLRLSGSEHRPD